MNVFALDFDGVLCDSVAEMAVTAWRAGQHIWPEWQGAEPPADCLRRFTHLRPLVETGYQTILLMRLIQQGLSDETITSDFSERCQHLLQEKGCSREQLAQWFGQTRDEWIARDLQDWLGRHRFYPKIIDTFTEKVATTPLLILTTKQQRFVKTLLEGQGIQFPTERIFGLDTGKSKEAILAQLLQRPEFRDARWHFLEDRLGTLLRVAARAELAQIKLYLADWGHNTAQQREQARQNPAITVWNPEMFLVV